MDQNMAQIAEQLKRNPALLKGLMQSQDGQRLMQMLTQGDRGAGLQQAVQAASRGNMSQMAEIMNRIMGTPDGAALVERINKAVQK